MAKPTTPLKTDTKAKKKPPVRKPKAADAGSRKSTDSEARSVDAEVIDAEVITPGEDENVDYAERVAQDAAEWQSRGWSGGTDLTDVNADAEPRFEDIKPLLPSTARGKAVKASDRAIATADPISQYMAEVRRYPLLTREQEQALAIRFRETGDKRAAEALVTSNLRFVVKVAAEYSKFGARLIDLVQEGNVGLMHAVREFNPYKGVRLITYAVWWIRGYIQDYLMRQYSMVRIGTTQSQRKLFYRLQKEKDLIESMGEEPSVKLLSSRLGVSEADVESMSQRMQGRDVSLQTTIDDSGRTTLMDFEATNDVPVDEQIGNHEMLSILNEGIEELRSSLNERELELLEDRLLADEPLTLQEIGEKYGVTREAVRQMENRLMLKIRKILEERLKSSRPE
jgi:RNA polymerase sigma-32 factor